MKMFDTYDIILPYEVSVEGPALWVQRVKPLLARPAFQVGNRLVS